MWLNRPQESHDLLRYMVGGIMLNVNQVILTITAIFNSGLLALGVGMFDDPPLGQMPFAAVTTIVGSK